MKQLKLMAIISIFMIFINISGLLGQELIFEHFEEDIHNMDDINREKLVKLKANPYLSKITRIKIPKLKKLLKEGEISFKLPNYKHKLIAYVDYVKLDETSNDFEWIGTIEDREQYEVGHLILHQSDGGNTYGELRVLDEYFTLENLGNDNNGNQFLYLLTHKNNLDQVGCAANHLDSNDFDEESDKLSEQNQKNASSCNSACIKVLVAYTREVQTSGINPVHKANASINLLNQAMSNSNFSNHDLKFDLVGVISNYNYDQQGIVTKDLQFESNQFDQLRIQHQADLMITYVYYTNTGGAQGVAWINDYANTQRETQGVVKITAENQTFAHEIVHLLGGRHQSQPSSYSSRAYGSEYCSSNNGSPFHTLMWSSNSDGLRKNFVSNPNETYQNCQIGSTTRNVYSRIDQNRCAVSQFFNSETVTPTLQISGSYFFKSNANNNYSAIIHDYIGEIKSYLWQISYNGFDFEDLAKDKTVELYDLNRKKRKVFLKVVVTLDNNKILKQTIAVKLSSLGKSKQINELMDNNIDETLETIKIFPNPTNNNLIIQSSIDKAFLDVEILDFKGRVLRKVNGNEKNTMSINDLNLPIGTYIIRCFLNDGIEMKKLVINK